MSDILTRHLDSLEGTARACAYLPVSYWIASYVTRLKRRRPVRQLLDVPSVPSKASTITTRPRHNGIATKTRHPALSNRIDDYNDD